MPSLDALFTPRSVAVVGASRDPRKLGHVLLRNLLEYGYTGQVAVVHPAEPELLGVAASRRLTELAAPPELVLVSVPGDRVLGVVREAAAAGARALVVLASGFGETGEAGQAAELELRAVARSSGMRLVGPNCMGVYNSHRCLNGSYFWDLPRIPGGISFVSQSGAYGGLLFEEARRRRFGVAKFLSLGNQVDLTHAEVVAYLAEDVETTVVALFIEGVPDGPALRAAVQRTAARKPVVVLKAGRTPAGRRASRSHTGALAGDAEVFRALLTQAGAVVPRETEEFFDLCLALASYPTGIPGPEGLALLTISGGPCVIASDACEELGLGVPPLREETRARVRALIPPFGASGNPVDMTPQMEPERFGACVDAVLGDEAITGALAINVGLDEPEFAQAFVEARRRSGKPILACVAAVPQIQQVFEAQGIPIFPSPERAARAYAALVRYARARLACAPAPEPADAARTPRRSRLLASRGREPRVLDEVQAKALLAEYGVAVVAERAAPTADQAVEAAAALGFPVAVKALRPGLLHKSDRGGVWLDVPDAPGVRSACGAIRERFGPEVGFVVQAMARGRVELILGGRRDPSFGPVVLAGLGGIHAEVYRDVALRPAPLNAGQARAMLRELSAAKLLGAYRGSPPLNETALVEQIVRVGELLVANPEVRELDVNPLIAGPDGCVAVDAVVLLEDETAQGAAAAPRGHGGEKALEMAEA
ncbi:MAG: acetate--CoA ligase family protein [Deltaproteobacteria bacterium]|nr:acetate--CoA ligase family protein [Deltaproteobacteria bacterium]